ncbi:MAG: energy transducer TonB [Myxococcales bacterium]|nr:energy transducer TonB [Myxococcales bacterium]
MGAHDNSKTPSIIVAVVVALLAHVALAALPVERPRVAPMQRTLKVSMRLSKPRLVPKKKIVPPPPPPRPQRKVTPPPRPRRRALTTRRARRRVAEVAQPKKPEPTPPPEKKLEPPPPTPPKKPVVAKKTPAPPAPPKARPAARVNLHGYLTSIYRRVVRYKHYPPAARRLRLQGRVLVRMRIDRSGKLLAAEVKRSSGHAVLDRAALGIVRNAAPYAGMPTAYGKPSVKIVVPVDFRLES